MTELLILGGHRYVTSHGFCVTASDDDSGPLDVSNAQVLDKAVDEYAETEDEEGNTPDVIRFAFNDWNARHAIATVTRKELADWIKEPTASSLYRIDPEDLEVFLTDTPPEVIVCESTDHVYVLEGSGNAIADMLSSYQSYPCLDDADWSETEQEMIEVAWNDWGYEEVTQAAGLQEVLEVLPWGSDDFTVWYWQACSDVGCWPEWSGPDVSFPAVRASSSRWSASLDLQDEVEAWVDEQLWAAVGGPSDEGYAALGLLCLGHRMDPREALMEIVEHAIKVITANIPWDKTTAVDWKTIAPRNAAPFPEVTWYARTLLLTGAPGLFQ